jgi:hypothetical protein
MPTCRNCLQFNITFLFLLGSLILFNILKCLNTETIEFAVIAPLAAVAGTPGI